MGDLLFDGVCAWVGDKEGRQILKKVSGRARACELTMLMGASGAGKSTLLSTLSGRGRGDGLVTEGRIEVGGSTYDGKRHAAMGAFVEQDTAFQGDLTPHEILTMRAALALASTPAAERKHRVLSSLQEMRLMRVAHTRIGVLGGKGALTLAQRKRLSLASALLVQPSVVLVDEPTTGLDARAAQRVVEAMADVARDRGIVILCTIHQPPARVVAAFDAVILMGAGAVAYRGPTGGLTPHMEAIGMPCDSETNPADHALDILDPRTDDEDGTRVASILARAPVWDLAAEAAGAADSAAKVRASARESDRVRAWVGRRLWELLLRSFRISLRNESAVKANLAQDIGIALLVGLLFSVPNTQAGAANRAGLAFLSITNVIFITVQASTLVTIVERTTVLSEIADGLYTPVEYILSKVLNEIPFQILYMAVYTAILYPLVGLSSEAGAGFAFFGAHLAVSLVGCAIGLAISTLTSDVVVANALAPVVITPAMMFSGFLVATSTIPVWLRWLRFFSPLRDAFLLILRAETKDLVFSCTPAEELDSGACPIPDGAALVDAYDVDEWSSGAHVLSLSLMYAVITLAAVISLLLSIKRRR